MDLGHELSLAANKLAKWRSVFAGWQLGTRLDTDGETRAVRDHREVTMMLRAEVNALTKVLIDAEVMTMEQWSRALLDELRMLDADYQHRFPGFSTSQAGVEIKMPEANETMKRYGFPP